MNIQIYGEKRKLGYVLVTNILWLIFIVALLISFTTSSMAGMPAGDEVIFYNLTSSGVGVVWQVETPSTCTVNVYTGQDGSGQLTPGTDSIVIHSITNDSAVFQNRGIMEVEVSGLSFNTTFYIQTVSTDSQGTHVYPELGSLLPVRTRTEIISVPSWANGVLAIAVYTPEGITGDPTENLISDAVVIVDVSGASSPIKADFQEALSLNLIDFRLITRWNATDESEFWDWTTDPDDHPFTISILGGLTFESGLGQKTINRTWLKADVGGVPCFTIGGNDDIVSCIEPAPSQFVNQTILRYDIPAEITMELPTGWSTISLPVEAADARISTLFPHAQAVFGYTNRYELLNPNDTLEVGKGYWINLTEPHTYTISGFAIRSYTFPNMPAGWSLIGGCSYPVQPGVQSGKIQALFGFTGAYQLLNPDDYLQPGKAYWINLSKSTTLNVPKKPVVGESVDMELPSGWSIISLPVEPDDRTIGTLFPDATAVFQYTNRYELLGSNDALEIGRGYWIYLPEPHTYTLTGMPIEGYTLTSMPSGWSVIGGCTYPAKVSVSNGTIQAIFEFTNKYDLLTSGDSLEQGKGYWINISSPANITVEIE